MWMDQTLDDYSKHGLQSTKNANAPSGYGVTHTMSKFVALSLKFSISDLLRLAKGTGR